jgi:hypothetical protein
MRARALGLGLGALLWALGRPPAAGAQGYEALARRSLLTTDARDERAVWVNPAGLARRPQANLAADLTVDRNGGQTRLAQYGLTVSSRSFGLGWEHDRYPSGATSNTYALALGLGDDTFSGGLTRRWNQGGEGAWDVALRGWATPSLGVSLVWRNIGSPVVRDTVYRDTFVPATTLRLLGGRFLAGAEADLSSGLGSVREIRAGLTITLLARLRVSGRAAFSDRLERRGIAVLVELGAPTYRGTLTALLPRGGGLGAVGASGAVMGTPAGPYGR